MPHLAIFNSVIFCCKKFYFWQIAILYSLFAFVCAQYFGIMAIEEQKEMSIVAIATLFRLFVDIFIPLLVFLYFNNLFITKQIDFILSRGLDRTNIMISWIASFGVIIFGSLILSFVFLVPAVSPQNLLIWLFSLFLEGSIMMLIGALISLLSRSLVVQIFVFLALYLLLRSLGSLIGPLDDPNIISPILNSDSHTLLLRIFSILLPRLDCCARSGWLVYGLQGDVAIFAMGAIQCFVLFWLLLYVLIDLFNGLYDL